MTWEPQEPQPRHSWLWCEGCPHANVRHIWRWPYGLCCRDCECTAPYAPRKQLSLWPQTKPSPVAE